MLHSQRNTRQIGQTTGIFRWLAAWNLGERARTAGSNSNAPSAASAANSIDNVWEGLAGSDSEHCRRKDSREERWGSVHLQIFSYRHELSQGARRDRRSRDQRTGEHNLCKQRCARPGENKIMARQRCILTRGRLLMVMARRDIFAAMCRDTGDAVANRARCQTLGAADQHDRDQQNGQFGMESHRMRRE